MADALAPEIVDLAHALGIATEYWDQAGAQHRVPADTVLRVLEAMQVDVTTPHAVDAAWDRLRNGPWRRMVPTCCGWRRRRTRPWTWPTCLRSARWP